MSEEARVRDEVCLMARSLFERGLSPGSSGNISARVPGGFLCTPTNSSFGFLDPARLSKLDENGRHVAGDRPTKEVSMHLGTYRGRPDARAITHLHSTWCVCLSCLEEGDPDDLIPPLTPYVRMRVGRVAKLPYVAPGDPAIEPLITAKMGSHKAVIIANHGLTVAGADVRDSVFNAEEIEEAAKVSLILQGKATRLLPV